MQSVETRKAGLVSAVSTVQLNDILNIGAPGAERASNGGIESSLTEHTVYGFASYLFHYIYGSPVVQTIALELSYSTGGCFI